MDDEVLWKALLFLICSSIFSVFTYMIGTDEWWQQCIFGMTMIGMFLAYL